MKKILSVILVTKHHIFKVKPEVFASGFVFLD